MEVMQACENKDNDKEEEEPARALLQTWLAKEAVPISQAVLGANKNEGGWAFKILMFFARKPMYIFGLIYFVKKILAYLEELGKEEDGVIVEGGDKEL